MTIDEAIERYRTETQKMQEEIGLLTQKFRAGDAADLKRDYEKYISDCIQLVDWLSELKIAKEYGYARWIPVTERLPVEEAEYVCTVNGVCQNIRYHNAIVMCFFEDGRWWIDGLGDDFNVSAWMDVESFKN